MFVNTHSSFDHLIEKKGVIIDLNHVFDVFLFIFISIVVVPFRYLQYIDRKFKK